MWFYEESRKRGMKLISVHKGYSYQSRSSATWRIRRTSRRRRCRTPTSTSSIYHSAIKHGPNEPNYLDSNKFDPKTGDFEWHSILMDIKKRNPQMNNVYPEVGSFFNALVVADPVLCMHGMGKNIKHYGADHVVWGTDCLWWGSPQWAIEAFKRFDISDEFVEKFGYTKISKADKAKIFGLNAAKLYNVDVKAKRNAHPGRQAREGEAGLSRRGGARRTRRTAGCGRTTENARHGAGSRILARCSLALARTRSARPVPPPAAHFHHVHLNAPIRRRRSTSTRAVQGAQGDRSPASGWRLDRRLVAAVHQGRRAAAERAAVRHLAHRLGRRGHAGGVSAAARQGHALRDAAHRHQRHGRRQSPVLLRLCRRPGPRADRAQHGEPSQLRARAHVQRGSAGGGRVVCEALRRAQFSAQTEKRIYRGVQIAPAAFVTADHVSMIIYPVEYLSAAPQSWEVARFATTAAASSITSVSASTISTRRSHACAPTA